LGKVPASFPPDVSTFVYGILGMSHGDPFRIDPRSVAYGGNIVLLDDPSAVPEPMSLLLVASGMGALGARRWRQRRRVARL
jgi:hypothetical protein